MSSTHLGSTTVAQIAIVVNDIEAASRRWADVLGVDVPMVIVTQPGNEVEQIYRGIPSNAQAKLAFFSLGQVQLELIEPIGDSSAWAEGLRDQGEAVHHIAFWVEGMQRSADFLKSQSVPLIHRGDMGEGQYAYFDSREKLGVMVELLEKKRDSRVTG